jgi:hypothetical protein
MGERRLIAESRVREEKKRKERSISGTGVKTLFCFVVSVSSVLRKYKLQFKETYVFWQSRDSETDLTAIATRRTSYYSGVRSDRRPRRRRPRAWQCQSLSPEMK